MTLHAEAWVSSLELLSSCALLVRSISWHRDIKIRPMLSDTLTQVFNENSSIPLIGAVLPSHAELTMSSNTINPEIAVSYAALILTDEGLEVAPDKLQALLKAAGVDIEPIWSTIFAKAVEGKDVKQILTAVQVSGRVSGRVQQGEEVQIDLDAGAGSEVGSDEGNDSECDLGLGLFD